MSTKTLRKRIALVAVSALGFGLLSMVPAQAADTTLTASSTTGTIQATASTNTAAGTFSLTITEFDANAWDTAVAQTYQIVDKYGDADTCEIKANDDGTPFGTIVTTGVSDAIFATASALPDYTITGGDLVVTFDGNNNSQLEHITISGLTVKCTSTAPIGNLYIKTSGAASEIKRANVTATGSLTTGYTSGDTTVTARINEGNFPAQALFETTNLTSFALGQTGQALQVTHSAVAVSPYWAAAGNTSAAATNDLVTEAGHFLRTGDALYVVAAGDIVTAARTSTGAALATGDVVYAIVASSSTFKIADTAALAAAGTGLDVTTAGTTAGGFTLRYAGSGVPAQFTVADQTTTLDAIDFVGQQIGIPASSYTAIAGSGASNITYLGKIGVVGATYKYYSTGTATAIAANASFTTTATAGEINIDAVTTGAINDGATTESVVLTLTNGVFYSAPTVTGASIVSTQVYPSATLSLDTVTANIVITGTYRFTTGTTAGSYLTYSVVVDNDTDPFGYIPLVTAEPAQNQIAILAGASMASTPAVSINILTTTGAAMSPITISESAAGVWKAGQIVGVCFADGPTDATADEDSFYTSGGSYPWGTVTSGNLKLAGNVTTLKGTIDSSDDVAAASQGLDEADAITANQCVYWTVYSTSTTASTITINGSNATNTGAATTGPVINTTSRIGVGTMVVVGGGALGSALALNRGGIYSRSAAALYNVSLSSVPSTIAVASSAQSLPDVSITEGAKGYFAAGTITVDLSDSANADTTGGSFAATVGANAPVVTQTGASNIIWDYAITDGNTVTITVRTASSDAPATFKISNVKINTVATKSGGVAPASSDFFYEVGGAGMNSQSYSGQWGNVASAASVTNADVLKSIVALIASINKQIQALQKLILKR
jgi:hypothetical protein